MLAEFGGKGEPSKREGWGSCNHTFNRHLGQASVCNGFGVFHHGVVIVPGQAGAHDNLVQASRRPDIARRMGVAV